MNKLFWLEWKALNSKAFMYYKPKLIFWNLILIHIHLSNHPKQNKVEQKTTIRMA